MRINTTYYKTYNLITRDDESQCIKVKEEFREQEIEHRRKYWFLQPIEDIFDLLGWEKPNNEILSIISNTIEEDRVQGVYYLSSLIRNSPTNGVKLFASLIPRLIKEKRIPFSEIRTTLTPYLFCEFVEITDAPDFNRNKLFEAMVDFFENNYSIYHHSYWLEPQASNEELIAFFESIDSATKIKDNPKLSNWVIGQTMKKFKSKANPTTVKTALESYLIERSIQ